MAFSPQFLEELKQRFTLSDVVGRQVKLVLRGREHHGLCPFHNEKTPSFTVNDQKEFYHCFGCGAHGSVFDFVMNTQGLTFPETIEMLAAEAGMEVPKQSREQQEREKKRATLYEVMDAVSSWYQAQLVGQIGRSAFDYIKGRGLTDETLKRFALGYAPNNRSALKEAMLARGIGEDQLIETGMLIKPDDGRPSYDRFRDRLMFPITDRKGQTIAFGGRALSKDAKAKYLNSPETTLFHKGATLYNWANARAASYDAGQVMVVEGYMDVIALDQFGVKYAVAPLGTALTEDQIGHLWHMADEPILSFDGDNAGIRAANRALERALPLLKPGKSLRFIMMPEGDDPDTLVQREGKEAIERLIDKAAPMSEMLWNSLTQNIDASTPERKAGLKKRIFGKLSEIQDEGVKKFYQGSFNSLFFDSYVRGYKAAKAGQAYSPNKKGGKGTSASHFVSYTQGYNDKRDNRPYNPFQSTSSSSSSQGGIASTSIGRSRGESAICERLERVMMLTLVNHPEILVKHEEHVATLRFTVPGLDAIRDALIEQVNDDVPLEREAVKTYLHERGLTNSLGTLTRDETLKDDWFAWPEAALADALTGFEHVYKRFQYVTAARDAYRQAEAEYAADMTEENHARFVAAQEAYRALEDKEVDKEGYRLESGRISFV
ncbi:DNA primase [Kordiimonas laminariae]|uniref:DNA primase n=1 Tax=Kordiimonas laminariae TaxID=2917717 RepID=UPI001FF56732|nr:DNA primase [Kordiimonas laminariae]MCK0067869.1 DNA primase [Kordiimonas laminariae]